MPDNSFVLAGDVGGTNLRIAAVASDGTILHQVDTATPNAGDAARIVDAIVLAARSCLAGAQISQGLSGFGLALAALVNAKEGRILSSPNLPELNDLGLSDLISRKLNLSVVLENDATAAAIGEHWLGASRGVSDSICVTLGTGIGGGLILGGRPYRGIDGTAGEIGHICVEPEGLSCGCGSRGCIEQYASATAIARTAKELLLSDSASALSSISEPSAKDVYEAAVRGDSVALETFRIVGRYLGIVLADLVNVLNPEVIVIGGGAAGAWDSFIGHVESEIKSRAFQQPAERVKLVRAALGESAGLLGAARVAFDSI
jgi:glucokinase